MGKRGLEQQAVRLRDISAEISVIQANRKAFKMPSWVEMSRVLMEALQTQLTPPQVIQDILQSIRHRLIRLPQGIEGEGLKTICEFRRLYLNKHPVTLNVWKIREPEGALHSMACHSEGVMGAESKYGADHIREVAHSSSRLFF